MDSEASQEQDSYVLLRGSVSSLPSALGSQFHKWVQTEQQSVTAALHCCLHPCKVPGGGAVTFQLILHRCRTKRRRRGRAEFLGCNLLILPVYRAVLWADMALSPPAQSFLAPTPDILL
ncbi:hypothetical protein KIL84_010243 [Mauremys mutica]|uniref:Uncharacterized protein n=1 Tax=Mauremys mutica TaxID=74926 RepID=A0A9D4B6Y4_9SAUR|nr:hypothetical protein KIL84_010243 [Mauremys mutica]